MKQLINYKLKQERVEGHPHVTLLTDREVLIGLPICAIEFGQVYQSPVIYGDHKGIPTVYEEAEVREFLSKVRTFHLKNNQGKLTEVSEAEADIHIKLPHDTKVDQLGYQDGQVYWAKPVEDKED